MSADNLAHAILELVGELKKIREQIETSNELKQKELDYR